MGWGLIFFCFFRYLGPVEFASGELMRLYLMFS